MLRPFICTCDKRLGTFKKFVKSYSKIKYSLKKPIVFYDGTNPEYLELIKELDPEELIKQPTDDVQYNVCYGLPSIAYEKYKDETILFLEDDILFSSIFPEAINTVELKMLQYPTVDLVTLFGTGECYWPPPENNNFIYRFNGYEYYGNLCFAIKPKVIEWWYNNLKKVWEHPTGGWDIKIGQMFEKNGFTWYCTRKHYVQHQIGWSAIDSVKKKVQSGLFVK